MTFHEELLLNRAVQRVEPPHVLDAWFATLPGDRQQDILRWLSNMAMQAGATATDVPEAVRQSGLKPTVTPCVLIQKGSLAGQLAKIVNLAAGEFPKAFRLLLALLRIADDRRRSVQCPTGCSHWWHRDLGDAQVLGELIVAGAG